MKNDILTLVREIEILRDRNLELEAKNKKHKEHAADGRRYSKILHKMAMQLKFTSNSKNERIAAISSKLVSEYEELKSEIKGKYDQAKTT